MKYKPSTNERRILFDLARSSKRQLHSFTIYSRLRLTPFDLVNSLNKLDSLKFIKMEDDEIHLTDFGLKWIMESRLDPYTYKLKPWRECPDEFKQEQLAINNFYVPRIPYVDKSIFKRSINGRRAKG